MKSKLLSLALCLCLIGSLLVSCKGKNKEPKDRAYNEAEVVAAAQLLIEKSKILNEIYYGEGIRYKVPENKDDIETYMPADPEHLAWFYENYGICDVETLKAKTREVFSEAGSASIISAFLDKTGGTSAGSSYVRYYMATDNEELDTEAGLMIYTRAKNYYENTAGVEYIYDGMYVSAVKGEYLTVSLKVKTTGKDGSESTRDITVKLIEEASGYRLSGATYALHPQS